MLALAWGVGCGTVDPGENFQIADVVFDENYYLCQVEPMLFEQNCGPGGAQDPAGGCHFNVTLFKLQDYGRLVGEDCQGNTPPPVIPEQARQNYDSAQRRMSVEPDRAELLNRPTRKTTHPRKIFDANSPEADIIREWATRFSSQ